VPHHQAHALAVLAEHGLEPPVLAFTWDGLGFAPAAAGTGGPGAPPGLWGGELLRVGPCGVERLVALRPFPLPGGERAMGEPRRVALGLLVAAGGDALEHPGAHHTLAAFTSAERALLLQAIGSGCNSPWSSSVGRLFDAVASLLGLVQVMSHEGEGGLRLQGAASRLSDLSGVQGPSGAWPLPLLATGQLDDGPGGAVHHGGSPPSLGWLDWAPLLAGLLEAIAAGASPEVCAARFHHALAGALAEMACLADGARDTRTVALAGGCFQNRLLLEASVAALRRRGLRPFWSAAVPCNDAGLAVGQVWAVRRGWDHDPGSQGLGSHETELADGPDVSGADRARPGPGRPVAPAGPTGVLRAAESG
jgi:hydrogenase maturation protein HypF